MSLASILMDLASVEATSQEHINTIEDVIKRAIAYDKEREERLKKLKALEALGVDNWAGYDEAMRELRGEEDEDDDED